MGRLSFIFCEGNLTQNVNNSKFSDVNNELNARNARNEKLPLTLSN